uniref:Cysteine-rich receptor-like protein kinase 10 n=1 Tax=Aegilops tauschii subsp. strangulata TaxID=200361 RepID=A0A453QDV2_AEGTS
LANMLMLGVLLLFLMPLSATGTAELCGSNYTTNSTYQSNLAVLAATLPTNASSSLQQFAAATVGQAPDAVHALALCRGDFANDTACADCVAASFQGAQQTCPNDEAATVYYDYDDVNNQRPGCVLGFSGDSDFLSPAAGLTENGTLFEAWNPGNISADATITAADVHKLLTVTAQDSAADTARRYSTAVMDAVPTLYSLAQCTPDLSAGDCLVCLQRLIGMVNATTSVRQGGRIFVLRCNIRFETFMFFDQPMRRINPSSITQAPPTEEGSENVGSVRLRERRTNKLHGGDHELVWDMETGMLSGFSFFEFDQIQEATGNFSEENKLGEGGFGPVYKGHFVQGMEIAVKRLASHSGQGLVEFKNEVQLIAKLQHRNLVRLLGCCSQGEEKILVYEYMPNKSLDFFIFDERRKVLMDWNRRLSIIEGIAEGLLYLHKHSRLRVIHRDLKPSNILLDNEMNPKISDFGLAKIFSPNNNEENSTRRVVGTYGYMAPEYASEGLFSIKSDVFSFGVLVLEILSGKRNSGSHQCGDFINLLGYAWQLWEDRRWIDIVDASLNSFLPKTHPTEIMRCINIALLCVQENAVDRPNMLDVTTMLSSKTMILREPKHPPYFNLRVGNEEDTSATQSCSINGVTLSIATAR